MILTIKTAQTEYSVVIEPDCTLKAEKYLRLDRKVLIVTDSGVPKDYAERIASFCLEPTTVCIKEGEESKSIAVWEKLLYKMSEKGFTRSDCVVAVGGGVVGDLAGFVSASYMRGVDFYNIPTTVLSQVDSSIGGKTAVNLGGIKNIVGAFYQPKTVLIDAKLLDSLPKRQIANGLAESIKMSLTSDKELFSLFESEDPYEILPTVIERSLLVKKAVVEKDEKEQGLRKVLNFGHTIGHGIESSERLSGLYHGECVALGMLPMCSDEVRNRLIPVLKKTGLPVSRDIDKEKVLDAITHDKKKSGEKITIVTVDEIGSFNLDSVQLSALEKKLEYFNKGEKKQ